MDMRTHTTLQILNLVPHDPLETWVQNLAPPPRFCDNMSSHSITSRYRLHSRVDNPDGALVVSGPTIAARVGGNGRRPFPYCHEQQKDI